MPQLLMGRLPAQPELVKMEFKDYASIRLLPDPPQDFGHETLIPDWGMLGNDQAGCCYCSAIGHNVMLWNTEAGVTVPISTQSTLSYYSEVTLAQNGEAYDPAQADPVTGEKPNGHRHSRRLSATPTAEGGRTRRHRQAAQDRCVREARA